MNLKGIFKTTTVERNGVRVRNWPIRTRLRWWVLRKLDAIDRLTAADFANTYMQPNGAAVRTLAGATAHMVGETA